MAKVLCAWEFGGDLGHVRRLMPIARELRAMGHAVCFAFRDTERLADAACAGFEAYAAPLLRPPAQSNPAPLNFSQILLNLGYDDRPGLGGAIRAWRSLFELARPDVVVADYAPTALLAARAAGLRRVTIGTGFSQPPLSDPLPALRTWSPVDPGVLRALDDRVVNAVRATLNGAANVPRRAAEIFEAEAHLLCTFAELDPFGTRAEVEYVGALGDAAGGAEIAWTESAGARVFAYLKPRDPRFAAVLQGLRASALQCIVAAPGLTPAEASAASGAGMRVMSSAVNLHTLLADASLCVSHAGPGLAARALVAGVPMALMPLQLEQFLIARRLRDEGVAEFASPEEPAPEFGSWFARLAASEALRSAARRCAEAHRGYSFEGASARAAQRIAAFAKAH